MSTDRSGASTLYRAWSVALLLAVVVNLAQFPMLERGLAPTWRAFTRAQDADLAAVAAERDESGVTQLQFGLVLALREHAPHHQVILPDHLNTTGVLSLELLTGLGKVICAEQQVIDGSALAAELPPGHVAATTGLVGVDRDIFTLFVAQPPGGTIVILDLRDEVGQIVLLDTHLLPNELRPTPTC